MDNDSIDIKKAKLNALVNDPISSIHKVQIYYNYLIDPNFKDKYYNQFNNINWQYKFDKLKNLFIIDKCIVITTINEPTPQILYYTTLIDWNLIIVGDLKTNNNLYNNLNCIYLSIDKQKELFPTLFDKIPYNSYTRKMFGYLYAIKNNYKIIYDTDDDNKYIYNINLFQNNFIMTDNIDILGDDLYMININDFDEYLINKNKNNKCNSFTFDKRNNNIYYKNKNINNLNKTDGSHCITGIFRDVKICKNENNSLVNIYKIFTDKYIWTRGIPPNHKSINEIPNVYENNTDLKYSIIQGLVNNDPDVDAYYRININNNDNFIFEKDDGYDIILDKYTVSPFNSQNTFWIDTDIFYTLYLPITVTFRYTDILRSFVALYQLWQKNKTIKFTFPTAIQNRNVHDLNKDFESEKSMYESAEQVIYLLNNNKEASIIDMYNILYDNKIVQKEELDLLNEWLYLIDH